MKRKWLAISLGIVTVLAAVALTGCTSAAGASTTAPPVGGLAGSATEAPVIISSQQTGIWTSGTGEVTVSPDVATLRLGVEAQETTVAEAQTQASEAMARIKAALADSGVAENDIQTEYFNIRQRTRWDEPTGEEIVTGYRVTNTITAKVRDIDEVGAIIDSVVVAGGDLIRVDDISFSVDDPSVYYGEAREKAMDDARTKAEQLAELAGVSLGQPTYISEGAVSPIYQSVYYEYAAGMSSAPMPAPAPVEPSISPGELKISLSVQVAYGILP